MKIVVIGGSGLIGTKLVNKLRQRGHEVVAASPASGVNTITGEGLAEALAGAQVVVDVANSPSWEDKAVLEFFETSGRNLLAAEAAAGVGHHVALSVVGTDRLLQSGYFRAKMAQENLIKASKIPYTIVRATQFFEFVSGIAQSATDGQTVRLSPALIQPIVSDDVADALAEVALGAPVNGTVELAGPERLRLDELVRRFLSAKQDARQVVTDVHARYFGIELNDQSLTPGDNPRIGPTRFEDWLSRSIASKVSYQAGSTRSSESAPNRKELPVTLPTLYREVRFRIREAADCRNGLLGSASLLSSQKLETFKCKLGDDVNCPECRTQNSADAVFCENCGSRLEVPCTSCGGANHLRAKFCKKCGQRLPEPEVASVTQKFGSVDAYTPKHLTEKILTSKKVCRAA